MQKPSVYSELYPGRFLKADLLKGQKVTLTIKDVDTEELTGENEEKKVKAILSFTERPMQLVMCKTNGYCIKSMFGDKLSEWIGRHVTLFESSWNGEPCIRIWGSPDIKDDLKVSIQLPRRKPFTMVMHTVKLGRHSEDPPAPSPAPTQSLDPRITAAFEILAWDETKQHEYLSSHQTWSQENIARDLNALVDDLNK